MFAGSDMHVRAIRRVAAGEQLTVAYINLMEPRRIRARELMESKHFACACERCTSPVETHPDRFLEVRREVTMLTGPSVGVLPALQLLISRIYTLCVAPGDTPRPLP